MFDAPEALEFLRVQAKRARWITSVCTGSFTLAAAGLLTGYRATSHWASLQMLDHFGVEPTSKRVVRDRNRITGAGVTSGIGFAFTLAAELFGDDEARKIQLAIEYDPDPPFDHGSPGKADPETVKSIIAATENLRMATVPNLCPCPGDRAAICITGTVWKDPNTPTARRNRCTPPPPHRRAR